jgi:hypothetical protein
LSFEEKTWEWATTPDDSRGCPIEGLIGDRDDAWRAAVLERLEDVEKWPQVKYVVFVQNVDMTSSMMGAYNVIIAGEGCTWDTPQIEELKENPSRHWVGDLPSQRMYPQWYISREAHLKAKESADG